MRTAQTPAELRWGMLLAALAALGYSLKAIFIKLAYPYGIDAVTLLTLRMAMSLPFFLWVWLITNADATRLTQGDWLRVTAMGIVGYYGASLLDFWGLQYISAGLERLILFTYPTLTILLGILFHGKKFCRREALALLLCYSGIALAFLHDVQLSHPKIVLLGSMLVFASSLCYASYLAGSELMIQRLGARRYTALAMMVSSLGIFIHFAVDRPLHTLVQPWPVYGWSLAMALLSTVAPVFALAEAIRRIGAGRAALASMMGPLLTIGFGWWLLEEAVTLEQTLGALLVVGGIFAVSRK